MISSKQIFLIEDDYQKKEKIQNLLNADSYQFLLEHQYLKLNDDKMAFEYVGVISLGSDLICVLPKYFKDRGISFDEKKRQFKAIIKVLKKIGKSEILPDAKFLKNSKQIFSEIALADRILKAFVEDGIYEKKQDVNAINSTGEINWDKTISTMDPIISKNQPIYHETYNFSRVTEDFNIITEIHKWAINYCIKKYSDILDYSISFTEDHLSFNQLGVLEHLLRVIEKELRITYLDRDIMLLENLRRILTKASGEEHKKLNIFGTGYFQTVWEHVCAASFKNKLEQFSSQIPKPFWHNHSGEGVSKRTLLPDVIALSEDESAFFILDAKYYNFRVSNIPQFTVTGNPGIGDVSKQLLYEKAMTGVSIGRKYNCFLFPDIFPSFFEINSSVTFDLLDIKEVFNIQLNAADMFINFIQNNPIGFMNLNGIMINIETIKKGDGHI
tara:strand:- start:1619 stop:2944 length:1326 start_codon:yes stop_codon:yes gene_type:complete